MPHLTASASGSKGNEWEGKTRAASYHMQAVRNGQDRGVVRGEVDEAEVRLVLQRVVHVACHLCVVGVVVWSHVHDVICVHDVMATVARL